MVLNQKKSYFGSIYWPTGRRLEGLLLVIGIDDPDASPTTTLTTILNINWLTVSYNVFGSKISMSKFEGVSREPKHCFCWKFLNFAFNFLFILEYLNPPGGFRNVNAKWIQHHKNKEIITFRYSESNDTFGPKGIRVLYH